MNLNKCYLFGRVGKDPVLKYTPSGAAVCNFSIATTERWKDKSGEMKDRTEWSNIVVWGKQAEYAGDQLRKGARCFIEGKLQTRTYEANGTKKYVTEVIAEHMEILDRVGDVDAQMELPAESDDGDL